MKKMLLIINVIILSAFISCHKIIDTIKLSGHSYTFKAIGDSTIVTSKGNYWVSNIFWDSTYYHDTTFSNCQFNHIDSFFQIRRQGCDTLFIKMYENKRNADRILYIELEAGDFFDHIKITQLKK